MDDGDLLTEGQSSHNMNNEKAIRAGLLNGRVVWFGGINDWHRDWLFYVENEHTLLSMWRAHALHPFERFDRGCYFFCVLCFSLFATAYVGHFHPMTKSVAVYCLAVTVSSALLVAYDYFLRFIAVMPCVQPGGSCYTVCWLCRDCCRDMGKQGLYVCVVGSVGFLIAGTVLASTSSIPAGNFFATFCVMKLCSYVAEFPPLAYFFYTYREAQRESWQNGTPAPPYPLGPSYPSRDYLLSSRHSGLVHSDPWDRDESSSSSSSRRRRPPTQDQAAIIDPQVRRERQERRDRAIELLHKARDSVARGGLSSAAAASSSSSSSLDPDGGPRAATMADRAPRTGLAPTPSLFSSNTGGALRGTDLL